MYFEGRVESLGLDTAAGYATVGVITPDTYTFPTEFEEHVRVTSGVLRFKLAGQEWRTLRAGETMRELDERFGLSGLIGEHLVDSRTGRNTQFPLADLLRQSVYSRLAGYEDLNDAARLSAERAFPSITSA